MYIPLRKIWLTINLLFLWCFWRFMKCPFVYPVEYDMNVKDYLWRNFNIIIWIYKRWLASSPLCSRNSSTYVRPDILTTSGAVEHSHLPAKSVQNQTSGSCLSRPAAVLPPIEESQYYSYSAPSVVCSWQYFNMSKQSVEVACFFGKKDAVECTSYSLVKYVIYLPNKNFRKYKEKCNWTERIFSSW